MKRFLLDLANSLLVPAGVQLYRRGFDMKSGLKMIANRQPGLATIIDMGAARGHWSAMALSTFPQARVIGVDPLREREPYLAQLKAANPRYDYVLAAAGTEDGGDIEISVTADLDGSTVHGAEGERRMIPVRSIDGIVREKQATGPFFLKFDTHGFERPILEGAGDTLAQTSYIVMETYNFRHTPDTLLFHEMIELLAAKGFRVLRLADPMVRPSDQALWQVDLFFARTDNPIFASETYRG
ncbi:FkbM family methyltransferase [Sphingomonas sp. MAH-20]|uniref:FkbM family methyltransferase n=2 Tax=Sphingomonadaceae TaxID=41297 RepID=A0A6I4J0C2_9SPHN|nr:FkbM family methyltransferase [Sphingomonas horti]